MEHKLLLIDGNSILNRAFYGLPEMTNSQGLHTNAGTSYQCSLGVFKYYV